MESAADNKGSHIRHLFADSAAPPCLVPAVDEVWQGIGIRYAGKVQTDKRPLWVTT